MSQLCGVFSVDAYIFVGEVAAPDGGPGVSQAQGDANGNFRLLEVGFELVEILLSQRSPVVDEQVTEGNRDFFGHNILLLVALPNSHSDTPPIGVGTEDSG